MSMLLFFFLLLSLVGSLNHVVLTAQGKITSGPSLSGHSEGTHEARKYGRKSSETRLEKTSLDFMF